MTAGGPSGLSTGSIARAPGPVCVAIGQGSCRARILNACNLSTGDYRYFKEGGIW